MTTVKPTFGVSNPGSETIDIPCQIVVNEFIDGDVDRPAVQRIIFSPPATDGHWGLNAPGGAGNGSWDNIAYYDEMQTSYFVGTILEGWKFSGRAQEGQVIITKETNGAGNLPFEPHLSPSGIDLVPLRHWREGAHHEVSFSAPPESTGGEFVIRIAGDTFGPFPHDAACEVVQAALGEQYQPWMVSGSKMNDGGLSLYRSPSGVGPTVIVEGAIEVPE